MAGGKGGRPTLYTPEVAAEICERIALGETLVSICKDEKLPSEQTVRRWCWEGKPEHEEFRAAYARAREAQMDAWADEIVTISDDGSQDTKYVGRDGKELAVCDAEWISRSRLRVDTRKFLMAKIAPRRYGERSQMELTGKDGGPIETADATDAKAIARQVAFFLAKQVEPEGGS